MFGFPKSKHWLAVLFVVVIVSVVLPNIATAEDATILGGLWSWVTDPIGQGIAKILYWLLVAEGWFLSGAGTFADWMLQPGPITTSTVVLVGWGITRDLANMLFILILLGVALDYILFQSFGVKRALPTLILVALLINFSLPIAGVLIDFANVFTSFFMGKITAGCGITEVGQECGFTVAIANNLNIVSLFNSKGVGSNMIPDLIFAIFFMAGTIFVFIALGVMFLYRTGMLYALLILLPIVLVLKPLPSTGKYFSQWSNYFIKWVMFAPAATFFLYLSMLIFQANVGADAQRTFDNALAGAGNKQNDGFIQQVYTYIIVWFFMLGSLMAAQSMGIKGASASLGMINGATSWASGKIKGKIKGAGKTLGREALRRTGADKKTDKAAQTAEQHWYLGGKFAGSALRGMGVRAKSQINKLGALTPQEEGLFKQYSADQLKLEADNRGKSLIPSRKASADILRSMASEKGGLKVKKENGEVDEKATLEYVRQALRDAEQNGASKDIIKTIGRANPAAVMANTREDYEKWSKAENQSTNIWINPKTGKKLEDALKDAFDINVGDMEKLKGTWTDESISDFLQYGLNPSHMRKASNINDTAFLDKLEKAITTQGANLEKVNKVVFNALKSGKLNDVIGVGEKFQQDYGGKKNNQASESAPDDGGLI